MKKCVNGEIIDMTPDEVTAYQEATITTQQQIPTAGFEDKMRVYIESIPTSDTPTVPPKIGFKWKLIYRGIARYYDIRDTVNPVYNALSELVGLYVEEV